MKRSLLSATFLLIAMIGVVIWKRNQSPDPRYVIPTLTGQAEYCITCHADLPVISPSHPVAVFGCVRCHGGERLALDADLAHSSMRGGKNPSQLSVVEDSCGGVECHSGSYVTNRDHIQRVMTSIQSTYAGAIANIRYSFGAQSDLTAEKGIFATQVISDTRNPIGEAQPPIYQLATFDPETDKPAAVKDFAANCLNCHLSAEPLSGQEYQRFAGCSACHTPFDRQVDLASSKDIHLLTTRMAYTQCNACHNRGNYDLREMKFQPRADHPAGRLQEYYQPIAQFTRCEYELDCIDCHTRLEAMGDGHLYNNQKEIQYIQCKDCHGTLTETPRTRPISSSDDVAIRMSFLNPAALLQVGSVIVYTEKGEPLWNLTKKADGRFELISKVSGERYTVPMVMGSACTQQLDQQESKYCHECHAVQR